MGFKVPQLSLLMNTIHHSFDLVCVTDMWWFSKVFFSLEVELRAWACIVQVFETWSQQVFIQSSNYWELDQSSLVEIMALDISLGLKVATLKWDIKGAMVLNKEHLWQAK